MAKARAPFWPVSGIVATLALTGAEVALGPNGLWVLGVLGLGAVLLGSWTRFRLARSSDSSRAFGYGWIALTWMAWCQKALCIGLEWSHHSLTNERSFLTFSLVGAALVVAGAEDRQGRMRRVLEAVIHHPARLATASFGIVIGIGGIALTHPASLRTEQGSSLLDGIFVATSAVCLTGLCPYDVPSTYTAFGQAVLLGLCQIGGLGYVVLSSALAIAAGRKLRAHESRAIAETVDAESVGELRQAVSFMVKVTLGIEFFGAIVLYGLVADRPEVALGPDATDAVAGAGNAAWWAVFHSVSAFCNCGFSLSHGNLTGFESQTAVLGVMGMLIFLGGIGFPVMFEIGALARRKLAARIGRPPPARRSLTLSTRVSLVMAVGLVLGGALFFFLAERSGTLSSLSLGDQIAGALFQSVSMRTGGFNSVDFTQVTQVTYLVAAILMLIGGSPVGTAGGVRTTTLAVALASIRANLTREKPRLFLRSLAKGQIDRAVSVIGVAVLVVLLATISLAWDDRRPLVRIFFEVASAFGTCGLSSGVTAGATTLDKTVLIAVMLIGRVGPTTFVTSLLKTPRRSPVELAEERVLLGS